MRIIDLGNVRKIEGISDFDLSQTLDSGQCFRYFNHEQGFLVMANNRFAIFSQEGDTLTTTASLEDVNDFWIDYFDLTRDYAEIKKHISKDDIISQAIDFGHGVRVVKQDFFEALITFIISQQNNIPRIKKIVAALCEHFGEEIVCGEMKYHAFPTPGKIASLNEEELLPINMGYRAPYILDAARKLVMLEFTDEMIRTLPYLEAKAKLKTIRGVGDKVANCVLLFGAGHIDAFPIDVWIKRGIDEMYGGKLDVEIFSPYGGIAQQYLFYYMRRK